MLFFAAARFSLRFSFNVFCGAFLASFFGFSEPFITTSFRGDCKPILNAQGLPRHVETLSRSVFRDDQAEADCSAPALPKR